jgi:translation initiation factor 4A
MLGVRCHACVGGTSVRDDIDSLRKGQHVVVGNPGRVYDMISKRHLRTDSIGLFVLDEADVLLSGNFKDQIYDIFKLCLNRNVQCSFFTTPISGLLELAPRIMRDPACILTTPDCMLMPVRSKHFYMVGGDGDAKVSRLLGLWGTIHRARGGVMMCCSSRREVDYVAESLSQVGLEVSIIHAELDQKERDLIMREFRTRKSKVLICTNDFARGLNVLHVRLVVNYNMPSSAEDYLLWSGRCGRFGRDGLVITLLGKKDLPAMRAVALRYHMEIEESTMEAIHDCLGKGPKSTQSSEDCNA